MREREKKMSKLSLAKPCNSSPVDLERVIFKGEPKCELYNRLSERNDRRKASSFVICGPALELSDTYGDMCTRRPEKNLSDYCQWLYFFTPLQFRASS